MKKIFAIFLLILTLAACGEGAKETLPDEFFASVEISADGETFNALYEKRQNCDKLTFETPEKLAGLEFTLTDGVCTVTIGDVSFEAENFSSIFDFLPVNGEEEKTAGGREYKIYDIRGAE
ncbi:MAG: hypothetical protein IJ002_03445 [Clostridia bacterium]|nr:hypothetical protein [Clostridia bacterium]